MPGFTETGISRSADAEGRCAVSVTLARVSGRAPTSRAGAELCATAPIAAEQDAILGIVQAKRFLARRKGMGDR